MSYQNTLRYLFNALPMYQNLGGKAYKADLQNALLLDSYFGHEHARFKTIHVGGTNGKGSVSHMLAAVFQEAGYKTGLYTSPHLFDFRERIKINGHLVPESFVHEFIEKHTRKFDEIQPSFFEMSVFLTFNYFAAENVDIAIIEVGLGGRLDTTNIISPITTVITNIGHDHIRFLGNNLLDISYQKAGIIKQNTPVIIGETQTETKDVFKRKADACSSKIFFADKYFKLGFALNNLDESVCWHLKKRRKWADKSYTLDLKGMYQGKNLCTVLMALDQVMKLDFPLSGKHISEGLKKTSQKTGLAGRWQIEGHNPKVVCDVAHNYEGFLQVLKQIEQTAFKNLHMVLGFVNDKDLKPIIQQLPKQAFYYLTAPNINRALPVEELTIQFEAEGFSISVFKSVPLAFQSAKAKAGSDDLIFIGGSTFVVADFLHWKKRNISF